MTSTTAGAISATVDARGRRLFSSAAACAATGASYRQASRWVERGLVVPTQPPRGSGSATRWSYDDLLLLRVLVLVSGIDGHSATSAITLDLLRGVVAFLDAPVPADGHLIVWPDGVVSHFDDLAALRSDVAVIVVPLAGVHEHVARHAGRLAAASTASPSGTAPTPPAAAGGGAVDGAAGTDLLRDEATGPDPVALVNTRAW